MHVRKQATVCLSGTEVIWLDWQRFKNPAEKFAARRAARFGREFDAGTQLGDRDGSDDQIVVSTYEIGESGVHPLGCDQYPGVDDQSAGYAGASETAASRAA